MSAHCEENAALQCYSPLRKAFSLSHIGSQILSSNFRYLKTVDGFIKLIHVVSIGPGWRPAFVRPDDASPAVFAVRRFPLATLSDLLNRLFHARYRA